MSSLRLAEARDFAAIAAATNHYIRTTAVHFGDADVTADALHDLWHRHRDRFPWLCAELDGVFAGYAKAGTYRERAAYQWTVETTIYLVPSAHGRGLGRRLYGCLLQLLAAQGFRSAIGGITLPNAASVALHQRLGFTACGVVRDAGFKFGRWHDVGFWQKPLGAGGGAILPVASAWASRPDRS